MYRIYRIINKAKVGTWITAPDQNTAVAYALQRGMVKKPENATIVDQTDALLASDSNPESLRALLQREVVGCVAKQIKAMSFTDLLNHLQAGVQVGPAPSRWILAGDDLTATWGGGQMLDAGVEDFSSGSPRDGHSPYTYR